MASKKKTTKKKAATKKATKKTAKKKASKKAGTNKNAGTKKAASKNAGAKKKTATKKAAKKKTSKKAGTGKKATKKKAASAKPVARKKGGAKLAPIDATTEPVAERVPEAPPATEPGIAATSVESIDAPAEASAARDPAVATEAGEPEPVSGFSWMDEADSTTTPDPTDDPPAVESAPRESAPSGGIAGLWRRIRGLFGAGK